MDDRAESGVVAEVLLIGLGLVLAAGFVVWFGNSAGDAQAPRSMGLARDPGSTSTTATYTITSVAAQRATWSSFRVLIDGNVASYDSTLAASPSYCVSDATGACIATGSWAPATTEVKAGQTIRFHATSLAGKHVVVADQGARAVVASLQMP